MDLLEHQGKALFAAAGLPVPAGKPAGTADAAADAAAELGLPVAVKAQVRTGGRGKAGGVRVCRTLDEAKTAAAEILAMTIRERPVEAVLVEQGVAVAHEAYLAFVLSRHHRAPLVVFAAEGGVDVEEIARTRPEAVLKLPVDPLLGLCDYQARDVAAAAVAAAAQRAPLADPAATAQRIAAVVKGLWKVYRDSDATLVEVNPLVVTESGDAVCLDAKVTLDDNALWRHADLAPLGPVPDAREARAREAGLSYISLDGDIGVIGNGAGLVMSTLDQLAAAGGRAANFCDVGGGASAGSVALALELILSGAGVRAIAVNIFGGITRGDQVAGGLIQALRDTPAAAGLPVFVRLDGTAAADGRARLAEAGLGNVRLAGDVAELVRLVCAAGA
jgi:succinyl-CoA synthetase beta subunit